MSADLARGLDLSTGAWGRAAFESQLANVVTVAKRTQVPLALVYVDADDFLEHEDAHGSGKTDELLGWLAGQIAEIVDGRGLIGRAGEDAFAIALSGMHASDAARLGEQIRMRVSEAKHEDENGPFRLTISVGVAGLRKHEPWGNLLEAAESACRRAKQGGRDRTARR